MSIPRYLDGLTLGAVVAVQGAGYRVLRAGPKELGCWRTGAELPALLFQLFIPRSSTLLLYNT